ncbi:MAG: glycosyltransferase [Alloprevotella sp.]
MHDFQPRLSLLICTIDERIARVPDILLPPHPAIRYVVSWQRATGETIAPPAVLLERKDVTLTQISGRGLSANRNNALQNCPTAYAVMADDDCRYRMADLEALIALMDEHPEVEIFCGRARRADGELRRKYSAQPFDYSSAPRFTYYASVEIAVRVSGRLPRFDERFGLGAEKMTSGEEEVFLQVAHSNGLKICYFPIDICTTLEAATTGTRFDTDAGVRRAKGGVMCIMYGRWGALLRCAKFALLHRPRHIRRNFSDMLAGINLVAYGR